ncbi:hypothetical protein [Flavobacterium sp.]|uniref:hypothetical protein n=1 Tax=Flavobacterium sp. TaxID=239 RepID=UPI0026168984|nr:hypothetical protein [Flavobacterium sp.]
MRNFKLITGVLFAFMFTSCSITEKMIINDNGSGKFTYDIDGSKMMSMMGSAFKGDDNEDTKKNKKETVGRKNKKVVDSTFTFKELFATKQDSISKLSPEEQAKIKKMERFSVRTIVDEEKGIMSYSMFTDFNSIAELQDVMSPVESMKSLSPSGQKSGGMGMAPTALEDNSSTSFFYDGKTFKKSVAKIEKKKEDAEKADEGSEEDVANSMKESLNMIYDQSSFKVVYQFPKAVKKVSIENALYSDDRKTITIEYPLKDYMENPDKLNFEVVFE